MAATVSAFRTRFPEFGVTEFPDDRVSFALADALLQMNVNVWGIRADVGQLYLAAHLLAIEGEAFGGTTGGATGPLTQESVGDVSRSYASGASSMSSAADDFAWTKYGAVYSRMKRTLVSTPIVL